MDSGYTSNELFHFVGRRDPRDHQGNYQTLLKVIRAGCVSHPPHEPGWETVKLKINPERSLASEELIVPTVTCFCDIPFDHLAIHVAKYGSFGVSFDRRLLVKYAARPVSYIPLSPEDWGGVGGETMLKDVQAVFQGLEQMRSPTHQKKGSRRHLGRVPNSPEETLDALHAVFGKDFLAFIKPFNSTLAPNDPNNFYMEREWRKFGNLCFDAADVRHVIVEESFVTRARQDLPKLSGVVIPAPTRRSP